MMLELYRHAAELLIQTFPRTLEPESFAAYGLQMNEPQKRELHRMLLSLWFYWVRCGLRVSAPQEPAHEIECMIRQWMSDFWKPDTEPASSEEFFATTERLHREWEGIMAQRDEPINVLSHAVSILEDQGIIETRDRHSTLAFFLDYVPIEEIGDTLVTIEAQFAG